MELKIKFFVVIISMMVIFAGCSSEEPSCEDQNTQYITYQYDEESEECVIAEELEENVCGNGIKEEGETYCNCQEDVDKEIPLEEGGCFGNKGEYLEYMCSDENKCELEMTENVRSNSLIREYDYDPFTIEATFKYNEPFATDRNEINVDLILKDKIDNEFTTIEDISIRSASILTSSNELLAKLDVGDNLANKYDETSISIPVNEYDLSYFSEKKYDVSLRFIVDYVEKQYTEEGEIREENEESIEIVREFDDELELIDPEEDEVQEETSSGGWDNY